MNSTKQGGVSPKTRYGQAMAAMTALGRADFLAGKPITAFPGRQAKNKTAAMFPDRARAAYEIGWRNAKESAWVVAEEVGTHGAHHEVKSIHATEAEAGLSARHWQEAMPASYFPSHP
jgi:hypothetical protein